MKKYFRVLVNVVSLLRRGGYLNETGWLNSIIRKRSISKEDYPLPWMTYSFIGFINDRLSPNLTLFEFGSGESTIYWAKRLKKVTSVEHDIIWYQKMKMGLPSNVFYHYADLQGEYVNKISSIGEKYDIIVIDGRKRVECAKIAPLFLKPSGIIIWDNSLREQYKEGIGYLEDRGFRHIDFKGLNPLGHVMTVTSVFYQQPNCINI